VKTTNGGAKLVSIWIETTVQSVKLLARNGATATMSVQ